MIVNEKGQIVGEDAFIWAHAGGKYWSLSPSHNWGIEPARVFTYEKVHSAELQRAQWELIYYNRSGDGFRTSTAHTYLYKGFRVEDCMRAAEINYIRRFNIHYVLR